MSVLVTGIGFVGAYIVRDLLDEGHDVVVYGLFGGRPGQPEAFPDIENAKDILGEEVWGGSASSWGISATATTWAAPSRSTA